MVFETNTHVFKAHPNRHTIVEMNPYTSSSTSLTLKKPVFRLDSADNMRPRKMLCGLTASILFSAQPCAAITIEVKKDLSPFSSTRFYNLPTSFSRERVKEPSCADVVSGFRAKTSMESSSLALNGWPTAWSFHPTWDNPLRLSADVEAWDRILSILSRGFSVTLERAPGMTSATRIQGLPALTSTNRDWFQNQYLNLGFNSLPGLTTRQSKICGSRRCLKSRLAVAQNAIALDHVDVKSCISRSLKSRRRDATDYCQRETSGLN